MDFHLFLAPSLAMQMFMALVKRPSRSYKISSQLMAEWLEKTKFCQNLCLAGQSNREATLGPNCEKLARLFMLKFSTIES